VRSPNIIPGSTRRIRILFVDDRREVAKTLAALLVETRSSVGSPTTERPGSRAY